MSFTVAPAARSLLDQATALWPNRSRASDGTIGDAAHAARQSDHNPNAAGVVCAADLTHDPAHGVDTRALADQIRLRAKAGQEPRLKYVISFSRIASPTDDWEWRLYDGDPHENHLHASVNYPDRYTDTSPWFAGGEELSMADVEHLESLIEAKFKAINDRLDKLRPDATEARVENIAKDVRAIKAKVGA